MPNHARRHAGPRRAGARLARGAPQEPVRDDEFRHSGYNGDEAQRAAFEASRISVTVVKRNDKQINGFIVLPKRWVVERTFGWINRARRLAKDFEATIESSLAWLLIALAFLLTRRLARLSGQQT